MAPRLRQDDAWQRPSHGKVGCVGNVETKSSYHPSSLVNSHTKIARKQLEEMLSTEMFGLRGYNLLGPADTRTQK